MWRHCFRALVPGGRLVCVVGDVCLSRRKHGRHSVMPLHMVLAGVGRSPWRVDHAAAIGMASFTTSAGIVSRSGGPAIPTIPGSAGRLTAETPAHSTFKTSGK